MNHSLLFDDPNLADLRIMPHSLEAEQCVIGALFLDERTIDRVSSIVSSDSFYRHDHRLIWNAAIELHAQNSPLDIVTFSDFLGARDDLEAAGGFAYLGTIAKDTPSAANVVAYAKIVRETYMLRQIIAINEDALDKAYNIGASNSKSLLTELESSTFKLADSLSQSSNQMIPISLAVQNTLHEMQTLAKQSSDNALLGVTTGSDALDKHTSGLIAGDLIIVAGRPSMGKTTFAMNSVFAVAETKPVAVFSMEMSTNQLVQRLFSSTADIHASKIRQPWEMQDTEWDQLDQGITQLKSRNIFIDASASLTVSGVRSACRRLIRKLETKFDGLGLIVIDYLQLMSATRPSANRNAEISEITRGLKQTALEFNVPIMLLSQLSREVEKRPNKRPVMSDLRDSGAIEQDADMILFLYRDEIYRPNKADNKGMAELIIRKFRNGQVATILQKFQGEYSRFCDLDQDQKGESSLTAYQASQTFSKQKVSTKTVRKPQPSRHNQEVF